MMLKTAICSCPIKFTKCVLLLEARALNYSVDHYHAAASEYQLIPPRHRYCFLISCIWLECGLKSLWERVKFQLQLSDKASQSRQLTDLQQVRVDSFILHLSVCRNWPQKDHYPPTPESGSSAQVCSGLRSLPHTT